MQHKTYHIEIRDRITGELVYDNTLYSTSPKMAEGAALRHAQDTVKGFDKRRVNVFIK